MCDHVCAQDKAFFEAHSVHGNKWSTIAKLLTGRTSQDCRERFNSHASRQAKAARAEDKATEAEARADLDRLRLQCAERSREEEVKKTRGGDEVLLALGQDRVRKESEKAITKTKEVGPVLVVRCQYIHICMHVKLCVCVCVCVCVPGFAKNLLSKF